MLSLFRTNQVVFNLLLLLYLVVLRGYYFLHPISNSAGNNSVFLDYFLELLSAPIYQGIATILLLFLQAFLINELAMRHRLFHESTLFPGLFYVLGTSIVQDFFPLSGILFGNLFLILALDNLLSTYKSHKCADKIFNAGFWVGIASLFYASFSFFFLLVLIGLAFLRAVSWKDMVVAFSGYIIPFLFAGTWYYWQDQLPYFWNTFFVEQFSFLNFQYDYSLVFLIKLGFIISLFSLGFFHGYEFKKANQPRKYVQVLYIALIISGLTFLFQPSVTIQHFLIMMVPLSFFLAARFLSFSKVFAELAHVILLILIIFFQYQGFDSIGGLVQ